MPWHVFVGSMAWYSQLGLGTDGCFWLQVGRYVPLGDTAKSIWVEGTIPSHTRRCHMWDSHMWHLRVCDGIIPSTHMLSAVSPSGTYLPAARSSHQYHGPIESIMPCLKQKKSAMAWRCSWALRAHPCRCWAGMWPPQTTYPPWNPANPDPQHNIPLPRPCGDGASMSHLRRCEPT